MGLRAVRHEAGRPPHSLHHLPQAACRPGRRRLPGPVMIMMMMMMVNLLLDLPSTLPTTCRSPSWDVPCQTQGWAGAGFWCGPISVTVSCMCMCCPPHTHTHMAADQMAGVSPFVMLLLVSTAHMHVCVCATAVPRRTKHSMLGMWHIHVPVAGTTRQQPVGAAGQGGRASGWPASTTVHKSVFMCTNGTLVAA